MQNHFKRHWLVYTGLGLGLCSILVLFLFQSNSSLSEQVYGQNFYPFYQSVRSYISRLIPNGILFYVPIAIVGFTVLRQVVLAVLSKKVYLHRIGSIIAIISVAIFWFYSFWGYNYTRPSLQKRMQLHITVPDSTYIFSDLLITVEKLNQYRSQIPSKDTIAWYDDSFSKEMQYRLKDQVVQFINNYGYKTNFNVFIHELKPKGILRRFGSSGMFLPWSGEAYFDSGVPNISRPSTYAHELSHVYGITNEGESNFVAYQACMNSPDPLVKYSGTMSYYRYAAKTAYQTDSVAFRNIEAKLDSLVLADFASKRKCGLLYPDLIPKTRDAIYDQYLKTQGVKTGLNDYSKVYVLQYAWQKKTEAN